MQSARASPVPASSAESANSSSPRTTQSACVKENRTSHVLARLQNRRDDSTAPLGHRFPAGALRDSVLPQLLVRFFGASDRAQLEFAELSAAGAQSDLSAGSIPLDAHCSLRHRARAVARLPVGLLFVVPRRETQGSALPTGDHSTVGELLGARLRMEDDPGQRWRAERLPAISAHHPPAGGIFTLQPICGDHHFDAHLHSLHAAADLRFSRTHPPQSGGSFARPGRVTVVHVSPRDSAPLAAGSSRRRHICIRVDAGRFPRAAAGRRPQRHHDFKCGGELVRRGLQLAARRCDFLLHDAAGRDAPVHHRAPGKKAGGLMSAGFQSRRAPLLLSAYAFLVYAFLYFPIIVLVVYSFNGSGVGGFPPAHWTFDWYRQLFTDAALWDAVLNSVRVAAVAVAIALGLGLPAALALDRTDFPGKALFRRLVLLPLILPGVITGLSMLMLFVAVGMKLSLVTITLGHGTALISVATTEIFAGLQKLERAQEEASLDLGANHWRTFWRVTLPNLRVSLIAAALLIFTLSLDEIAVSFFLIGRENTLPLEIWSRLRRGITPEINAISTLILLFSIGMILLWYRLRTRLQRADESAAPLVPAAIQGESA